MIIDKRRSSVSISSLEKKFQVDNAFKRNKRYLNFNKINKIQDQYQTSRRKPFTISEKSVDDKISTSFLNTTAAFSDRLQQDIDKFKIRMSRFDSNSQCDLENLQQSRARPQSERLSRSSNSLQKKRKNNKKIHGVQLGKYSSREQYYRTKGKPCHDERLFNNFALEKADQKHIADFNKGQQRNLDFSIKNLNLDIQYNTQKLYQQYYYSRLTMDCRINYKTQKRTQRQFYNPRKTQNDPQTQLSPQKVKQSYQKCIVRPKSVDGFYADSGRQLPCNLDMRMNTNLTNHWVGNNGKIIRKKLQYSIRKQKTDIINDKMLALKERKKPKFERTDLCDEKYFRVNRNT